MTSGIPRALAGLGFFVDVVAGGAVAGIGAGDDLDAVAARLGDDYIDDRNGHALRRDYGLVEFYWDWSTAADRWTLTGFQVEVHRLAYGHDVPARLGERYQFASRVPFEWLRSGVEGLGLAFEEITTDADLPGYRRFWCAETGIGVVVLAMASTEEPHEPGDVWSIQPEWRGTIRIEGDEHDRGSTTDGLAHLLLRQLPTRRVRRGGYPSQAAARRARDEWLAATEVQRTANGWTVERRLRHWLGRHTRIRPTSRLHYTRDVERVLIPHLGKYRLADLDARLLRTVFDQVAQTASTKGCQSASATPPESRPFTNHQQHEGGEGPSTSPHGT